MNSDSVIASIVNLPVVGVALGLMFTYLIASLVASTIKEAIASVFQWRGTYLQHGIGVLLSNLPDAAFSWGNVGNWLRAHFTRIDPTAAASATLRAAGAAADAAGKAIAAVSAATAAAAAAAAPGAPPAVAAALSAANATATSAGTAASTAANTATAAATGAATARVVTPETATLAHNAAAAAQLAATAIISGSATDLANAAAATATAVAALNVHNVRTHPLLKGTPSSLPSYVPARDFATALLDMLRDGSASPAIQQVERSVAALPDGDIKRILTAFIQDAAGDLDKLRARIETWFDDAMDRLSGIYKRFTQYFLLALGLLIAVVLNVDSVHLADALWQQPALRAQIVAQVQADIPPSTQSTPSSSQGGSASAATATAAATTAPATGVNPAAQRSVQQAVQQLNQLPLPIGRTPCASVFGEPPPAGAVPPAPAPAGATALTCPDGIHYASGWTAWNWWTLLGWVVTAFAISLGAPFWFDLLQNIMNLRAAGTPPPRADGTPQK